MTEPWLRARVRINDLTETNAAGDYDDARAKLDRLRDAVAPLLDREVVQPFITAWEFETNRPGADGEEIHQRLREAWGEST